MVLPPLDSVKGPEDWWTPGNGHFILRERESKECL